ncbi:MAG TPA: aconitase X catalytic domain-containing protein [Candidatus Acidoferrum sp.]|nr:aconitase X catalytic domain-containing protein [Candidatus Acidoferrum sp.]
MYLTKEEERTYDGEHGWANQKSMEILVRLGELFQAKRLIPISSAHVSGVSYKTIGDAPIEYLEALANDHAQVKVNATLNPQSLDREYLGKKYGARLRDKQLIILRQFERMGFTQTLTCTPYYLEKQKRNAHLAWAESSAVVYSNSVLGAWTNREGGPSALAAAIIGKTPDYGIHKAENRQPKVLVKVAKRLQDETEFGALGAHLGRILGDRIPTIRGLDGATKDDLKQLGAALASTGMVNMFYCGNEGPSKNLEIEERIVLGAEDIKKTAQELCPTSTEKPDLVIIGCPHCSLNEIKQVANLIGEKKVKTETELWVCTSPCVKQRAKKYVKKIERSGGHVLEGVCTVVSWTERLGVKTIMTNSAKTAHYAPTLSKADAIIATKEKCLQTALRR